MKQLKYLYTISKSKPIVEKVFKITSENRHVVTPCHYYQSLLYPRGIPARREKSSATPPASVAQDPEHRRGDFRVVPVVPDDHAPHAHAVPTQELVALGIPQAVVIRPVQLDVHPVPRVPDVHLEARGV